VVGLLLSYHLNLASGATIVVLLGMVFFATLWMRRGRVA
jgi:ABC-type Mn2+/Zn2+ transport system permease subunit